MRTTGTAIIVMILQAGLSVEAADFAGGTGEPNDPYQIATAEQLTSIGSDPNLLDKHYVLLNDIDLDPNLPGGRVFSQGVIAPTAGGKAVSWAGTPFTGSLDGRGHEVRNLTIRAGGGGHLGLFGNLGRQAVVEDLGIADADVDGGTWSCGALAGSNGGRISRCYARARVSGWAFVAVLVGCHGDGEITDCRAEGEVIAAESVGGLVGENCQGGAILNSSASSRVISRLTVNDGAIGGLVGKNWGDIVNCYATGDVSSLTLMEIAGGLVGTNVGNVVNCHATGNVSATRGTYLGGLVGENTWFIVHSYATGNVSGGTSAEGTRDGKPAGSRCLGGLVGWNNYGNVYACYAGGDVSGGDGSSSLGGLVGSQSGDVLDSYCIGRVRAGENSTSIGGLAGSGKKGTGGSFWDIEASALAHSAGGTGLTTAQMQDAATFLAAGWDWMGEKANGLVDPWFIPEGGGYPMLTFGSEAFQRRPLDGSGTADDPCRIVTAEDLAAINRYDLTGCYRLEADIDLGGITWKEAPIWYFNGEFDGAGRIVLNLKIQGDTQLGLFGTLDRNASVVGLGVRDANVTGRWILGMLAGSNRGRIEACRADGAVSGIDALGGLTASNEGSISDSYATGAVTTIDPKPTDLGGLTGWSTGSISRCYAAVHVTSTESMPADVNGMGGLVGKRSADDPLNLFYVPGPVYDSYFLIDSDGGGRDNGLGAPLTDAQMRQQTSFAGWDFENTWAICEGRDYPRLRWEGIDCNEP